MKTLIKGCGIAVLLSGQIAFAQAAELNSQNIKVILESKSAKVRAVQSQKAAAEEREGSMSRSFFPTLDLYAGQDTFKIGSKSQLSEPTYGAELKVNLFNGGKDSLEGEVRKLDTQKKTYETQRILTQELEKARNSYWSVLYYREKAVILKTALDVNRQNLAAADKRIRNGVATESDRMEFEMKATELSRELTESQIKQESEARTLKVVLGVSRIDVSSLSEKLDHEHSFEDELKHEAKDHEFLVKENEILAQQNDLRATKEKRTWLPKLDAFAAYNQYTERDKEFPAASDRTETVVGVRVSLSIATGLEASREAAALRQESLAAKSLADFQQMEVEAHLANEMAELQLLHSQIHDADENIKRAEKYYRLTQSEYARGVKNSPDVLGASEKLFETRHKRLEIVRDFQLAKAHVLSKIGK